MRKNVGKKSWKTMSETEKMIKFLDIYVVVYGIICTILIIALIYCRINGM